MKTPARSMTRAVAAQLDQATEAMSRARLTRTMAAEAKAKGHDAMAAELTRIIPLYVADARKATRTARLYAEA